ncbi:MAG: segregation/condensation protein A [Bacilli bacterium]|nr:segregation/condensation protein A [Bacilli bacterium]
MDIEFKIDKFEGPLDLLLHLVKINKMNILDIEIEKITEQYLNYLNKMEKMNLEITSNYLVIASELIYIKSKMLLPRVEEEIEEDPREELATKLIEYQVYKEITEKLKEKERNRKEIYTNSGVDIKQYVEDIEKKMETNVELDDLVNAFKKFLLRREEEKPIKTKITEKEITVQERKTRIKNILLTKKKISFYELFEDYNKEYILATFLAILELTKEKTITIKQENTFSDIICEVI